MDSVGDNRSRQLGCRREILEVQQVQAVAACTDRLGCEIGDHIIEPEIPVGRDPSFHVGFSGDLHARIPSMAAVQDDSCIGHAASTVPTGRVGAEVVKGQYLRDAPEARPGTGDALKKVPILARGERGVKAADGQGQVTSQGAGVDCKMAGAGEMFEQICLVGP